MHRIHITSCSHCAWPRNFLAACCQARVSAKFWLEYSYLSYEKARMEKLCLPWREQACDLSGIDMLVDMHTFDSAVVVQAAGKSCLNQAKT